jgi:hypothetical protein
MIVAPTDNRITNRENDFCWLKAIRLAINDTIFNPVCFLASKIKAMAIKPVFF